MARVLVRRGIVPFMGRAFERYIGRGGPAYIPSNTLAPAEAIRRIRRGQTVKEMMRTIPDRSMLYREIHAATERPNP